MDWIINKQVIQKPYDMVTIDVRNKFVICKKIGDETAVKNDYTVIDGMFTVIRSTTNLHKLGIYRVNAEHAHTLNYLKRHYGTDLEVKCGYNLYPFQRKTMNFILRYFKNRSEVLNRLLIDLAPGSGKGLLANYTVDKLGLRPLILIKPTYIKKWIEELIFHYQIEESDICIINKISMIEDYDAIKFDNHKVVIITTNLITSVCKHQDLVDKLPSLLEHIKSTLLINDESHQHFDAVSHAIRILNPTYVIGMSASLVSNDTKEEDRQLNLFPKDNRLSFKANDPHIYYNIAQYVTTNTTEAVYSTFIGYNHNLYETNILKCARAKRGYSMLIAKVVKQWYIDNPDRDKDDKILILVSSLDMVDFLVSEMERRLVGGSHSMKVSRYTGKEEYEIIKDYEVLVATTGKAGTAIDIPNLFVCVNTVNLGTYQLNMQIPGRLRKRADKKLHFVTLQNQVINKHGEYLKAYLRKFGYMYISITKHANFFAFVFNHTPRPKPKPRFGKKRWF